MADICLLLEGTYPYVTGGVSSCVHQLIQKTPSLTYDVVYIGDYKREYRKYKYSIPFNVNNIYELYLFDENISLNPRSFFKTRLKNIFKDIKKYIKKDGINSLKTIKDNFKRSKIKNLIRSFISWNRKEGLDKFQEIYTNFFDSRSRFIDPKDILFSLEAWEILQEEYDLKENKNTSFIDFFYTWRFSFVPLIKILSYDLPRSQIYYSLCTGYAGLLGAVGKQRYNAKFLLTEHGLYTNERKLDLLEAEWEQQQKDIFAKIDNNRWWESLFQSLSILAYEKADIVTTLFKENQEKQISQGCSREKSIVLPNGINILPNIEIKSKIKKEFIFAFVGRVVAIKDVKTLIRAIDKIDKEIDSNIKLLILGPLDEEPEYVEECRELCFLLDLNNTVTFLGQVDMKDYYPIIDVLILSSVSEGQPIVLLEAFMYKIATIATDVGGCKGLLEGVSVEDKKLGKSGIIISLGDADMLAKKMFFLLKNQDIRNKMGEIGFQRLKFFYTEDKMVASYKRIFTEMIFRS